MELSVLLSIFSTMLLILACGWVFLVCLAVARPGRPVAGWALGLGVISAAYIISWCYYVLL